MKKPKLTPEESLQRIKLMMNYDASRTLLEQTNSPWEMAKTAGKVAGGAAALGAAYHGVKTVGTIGKIVNAISKFGKPAADALGSVVAKGMAPETVQAAANAALYWGQSTATLGGIEGGATLAAAPEVAATTIAGTEVGALAGGETLAAGATGAMGVVGASVLAGAVALAVVPLVLWLIDKDQAYPKVKKLFEYVKNNKEKIDQVPRGLDDETIQTFSDDAYNAMKGLGTNNKLLFSVFDSLVTVSDLSALISTFNEDHENEGDGDFLEWLDSDIDISSTWNRIYTPCRNIVKRFAKSLAAENIPQQQAQPAQTTFGADNTYQPCTGTYSFGCESESIRKIQGCLGLVEDGKLGPKTQAKLGLLGKGYDRQFTDADVQTICGLASTLIQRAEKLPTAPTSQLKLSPLAPNINTTTLPPPPSTETT